MPTEPAEMTSEEKEVGDLLAAAWNKFVELPTLHHADRGDFEHAIHAAQNIVLARVGLRSTGVFRPLPPNEIRGESENGGAEGIGAMIIRADNDFKRIMGTINKRESIAMTNAIDRQIMGDDLDHLIAELEAAEQEHTSGKWEVDTCGVSNDERLIAENPGFVSNPNMIADMRYIAAAPDRLQRALVHLKRIRDARDGYNARPHAIFTYGTPNDEWFERMKAEFDRFMRDDSDK